MDTCRLTEYGRWRSNVQAKLPGRPNMISHTWRHDKDLFRKFMAGGFMGCKDKLSPGYQMVLNDSLQIRLLWYPVETSRASDSSKKNSR